jgi:hypothetical protein
LVAAGHSARALKKCHAAMVIISFLWSYPMVISYGCGQLDTSAVPTACQNDADLAAASCVDMEPRTTHAQLTSCMPW